MIFKHLIDIFEFHSNHFFDTGLDFFAVNTESTEEFSHPFHFFFFGHLSEFTFFPLFHGPHLHVFLGDVTVLNSPHDFSDLVTIEKFFFDHGFDNWKIWFHHLELVFHHVHDFTLDHFHHLF